MKATSVLLVLTTLALAGCGGGSDSGQPAAAPSDQPTQPVAKNLPPAPPPVVAGKAQKEAAETEEAAAEAPPKPERHGEREAAKAGVSGKGNYGPGVLTTPIQAYFRSRERFSFMQVEQAMNLYKGEHGYFPKTEKEFFKQIIEANSIPLPKLPSGCRYIYDAAKAAKMGSNYNSDDPPLLVEHPRR